jgi:hypothetical protein
MEACFVADVFSNRNNAVLLERWDALALPDSWLVAGCLFQTVWNRLSGSAPEAGIKDYDIFYFDQHDLSEAGEREAQRRAEALFSDLNITLEVCNQARVHLWYESHFGHPYPRLRNSKDGIERFLIPATCVGMNPQEVYAPNGLELLYSGTLAMNPLTPHGPLYQAKALSYRRRWPWLKIT